MSPPPPLRPYTRCQECGVKFPAARAYPFCLDCDEGQARLFDERPEGFAPVVQREA